MNAGCVAPEQKQTPNSKTRSENDQNLPSQVTATQVTYKAYGPLPNSELYYAIQTSQVNVELGTEQIEHGVTGKVSGTVYTHGPTQFSADMAQGQKSSPQVTDLDVLILKGNVAIHSQKPAGDLFCDQLRLNLKTHIIRAKGHVRFNTTSGLIGTLPEAWATQDLAKIASPELFQKKL
jgi:lipopolysaccharide assembly outer membrane protein LptD (OstA)